MSFIKVAVAIAALSLMVATGAQAASSRDQTPDVVLNKSEPYEKQYLSAYAEAKKVLGKKDAGRNIYVDGLPSKGGGSHIAHKRDFKRITADLLAAIDRKQNPPVVTTEPTITETTTTAEPTPVTGGAGGDLASIRACESGGNYSTNTGNGYYGAYQFNLGTWQAAGGTGNPATASPAEQDAVAAAWIAAGNRSAWPNC
jgi:hypothetical protein